MKIRLTERLRLFIPMPRPKNGGCLLFDLIMIFSKAAHKLKLLPPKDIPISSEKMNLARLLINNFFRFLKMIPTQSRLTTWKMLSASKESRKNFLTSTRKNFIKSEIFWKIIQISKLNLKRMDFLQNNLRKNFWGRLSFYISCRKKAGSALKKILTGERAHRLL